MGTILSKDDLELHEAFEVILSIRSFSNYINEIAELIYNNALSRPHLEEVLRTHKIENLEDIKEELLDLLLVYINLTLNNHIITENEKRNVKLLKMLFKIKEGDFYEYRYDEIEEILHRQFERLYLDNNIDKEEAIHKVGLQEFFDLGYDQFEEFKENEIQRALEQGALITDLDTTKYPKTTKVNSGNSNRHISQEVKDLVWNRDGGQCIACSNNENLEFDHIIPFSKGGSNTYRNIQLLCEPCNRQKANKIG